MCARLAVPIAFMKTREKDYDVSDFVTPLSWSEDIFPRLTSSELMHAPLENSETPNKHGHG